MGGNTPPIKFEVITNLLTEEFTTNFMNTQRADKFSYIGVSGCQVRPYIYRYFGLYTQNLLSVKFRILSFNTKPKTSSRNTIAISL